MKHIDTDSKIHLSIYGPKEDELYFQKCKEVSLTIQDNVSIAFHEEVEHEKIQHIIQKHHVFILPTLGENFGHSIFESFASGRPVIISDQTPWRNLENKMVGFDLPLNEKGLWISSISKFVDMDQLTYDSWCKHAHQFGVDFINSTNLKNKYIQLFS
jgi:glycosyltransferase involved in cell wall biosynthesis